MTRRKEDFDKKMEEDDVERNYNSNASRQKLAWDDLKSSINDLVEEVNINNVRETVKKLLELNISRGRGWLVKTLMLFQTRKPADSNVYAALAAILNSKFSDIGFLLIKRLLCDLRKIQQYAGRTSCALFIAHLTNQKVVHGGLAYELLDLWLKDPTNFKMKVALTFLDEVGDFLVRFHKEYANDILKRLEKLMNEGNLERSIQKMMAGILKTGFENRPYINKELDLIEDGAHYTHKICLALDTGEYFENLNCFTFDSEYMKNEEKYEAHMHKRLGQTKKEMENASTATHLYVICNGVKIPFRLKKSRKLMFLKTTFLDSICIGDDAIDHRRFTFKYNGVEIKDEDTVDSLKIIWDDCVFVTQALTHGCYTFVNVVSPEGRKFVAFIRKDNPCKVLKQWFLEKYMGQEGMLSTFKFMRSGEEISDQFPIDLLAYDSDDTTIYVTKINKLIFKLKNQESKVTVNNFQHKFGDLFYSFLNAHTIIKRGFKMWRMEDRLYYSFKFNGQEIEDEDTPGSLNMKDGDLVNVKYLSHLVFVFGENGNSSTQNTSFKKCFKDIKKDFIEDLQRWNQEAYSVKCKYKNMNIKDEDTPLSLNMEDGDRVYVEILDLNQVLEEVDSKSDEKVRKKKKRNRPSRGLRKPPNNMEEDKPKEENIIEDLVKREENDNSKQPEPNSAIEKVSNFKGLETRGYELEERLSELQEELKQHKIKETETINSHASQMKEHLLKNDKLEEEKATHMKELEILKGKIKDCEEMIKDCDIGLKKANDKRARFESFMKKKRDKLCLQEENIESQIESVKDELEKCREDQQRLEGVTVTESSEVRSKSNSNSEMIQFLRMQVKEKESSLECPVCLEVASVPIFACPEMHLICSSCCPKLKECPECRAKYQNPPRRHRFREETAVELKKLRAELLQHTLST